MTKKIGFLVSEQGRLALEAIRRQRELGFDPAFVLLDVSATSVLEEALQSLGVKYGRIKAAPRDAVQEQIFQFLEKHRAEKIFLTFNRILNEKVLSLLPGGFINLHLSLLPAFPGMRAWERALESGAPFVGATMHLVTPKVDDGPPLAQCVHPVAFGETRESIGQKMFPFIRVMYLNVVRWAALDRISPAENGRAQILKSRPGTGLISPEPEWWPDRSRSQDES